MPNRILRDGYVDSDSVASLSDWTHRVYSNLLVKCDDAGRFDGRREILRSHLFPLGTSRRNEDFDKALTEMEKAGLLVRYEWNGKPYLQLTKWQRCGKAIHSRFPWSDGSYAIEYLSRDTRDGRKEFVKTSISDPIATPCLWDGHGVSGETNTKTETETNTDTLPPHTPQGGCVSPEGDGPHGAAPERAAGSSPDGEVSVTPDGVAGFDRFWAAWPKHHRKVGKSKCLRLWKRLKLESVAEQVIAAVRRCKASPDWTKENGQYIPMPHSWLNKTPWETDPTELEGEDDLYSNGFTPAPVTDEILALLDAPACNADAFSGAGMGHESSEQEKRASVDGRGQ